MAEVGTAFVSILPSAKGFGSRLSSDISGPVRGVGSSIGRSFGKMFVLGASVIAAAGIGNFLKGSIEEAREAQKVGAATSAIIKSTGGAAKITAGQVGEMATRLSNVTGIDDEAIQSGENLLLTFKNVRNEVGGKFTGTFDQATQAALDLSAAGFGSIESASKTMGKALNDPVKGVSALSRAGVTFTEQQKDQIKVMTESGDLLGAQNIILKEVKSQVGGVAAATATNGEKAKVAFDNIKEQIGTALLPAIDKMEGAFLRAVPTITKIIAGIGPFFSRVGKVVGPVAAKIGAFFTGGSGGGFLSQASSTAKTLSAQLMPTLKTLGQLFVSTVLPAVLNIANTIRANFVPVLKTMATMFTTVILPNITRFVTYVVSALAPVFTSVINIITTRVIPIFASLARFFYGTLYPAVVKIVASVAQQLRPVFDQLVTTFRAQVLPAVDKLLAAFQRAQPTLQKVVMVALKVVGAVLKIVAAILAKVLPVLIRLIGFIISKAVPILISIVTAVAKVVGALITFGKKVADAATDVASFARKVGEKIADVVRFFNKLPQKVLDALKSLPGKLLQVGKDMIDGIKKGATAAWDDFMGWLKSKFDALPGWAKKLLHAGSPAKVMIPVGESIPEGVAAGVAKAAPKMTKKIKEAVNKAADTLRSRLSTLQDQLNSIASGVTSNLVGNLFEATTGAGLVDSLTKKKAELKSLMDAFTTLKGWGLSPQFLSNLFAQGGAALILDLAAGGKAQATSAADLFSDVTNLGNNLGDAVGRNEVGDKIDQTNALLTQLLAATGKQAQQIANGINHPAGKGKRHRK